MSNKAFLKQNFEKLWKVLRGNMMFEPLLFKFAWQPGVIAWHGAIWVDSCEEKLNEISKVINTMTSEAYGRCTELTLVQWKWNPIVL